MDGRGPVSHLTISELVATTILRGMGPHSSVERVMLTLRRESANSMASSTFSIYFYESCHLKTPIIKIFAMFPFIGCRTVNFCRASSASDLDG
jgi:hypothetical protein